MLYSDWINNSKDEKVKVIFLKHHTLRLNESQVIHFHKDGAYFLPVELAKELEQEKVCTIGNTVQKKEQ